MSLQAGFKTVRKAKHQCIIRIRSKRNCAAHRIKSAKFRARSFRYNLSKTWIELDFPEYAADSSLHNPLPQHAHPSCARRRTGPNTNRTGGCQIECGFKILVCIVEYEKWPTTDSCELIRMVSASASSSFTAAAALAS